MTKSNDPLHPDNLPQIEGAEGIYNKWGDVDCICLEDYRKTL